mmetsp:Transcript_30135/g.63012  ORF Transcript_30135/g.63012 Transcript_30135/m.63012 type:complete len:87 (-) Transcript_30135:1973-2233(-)
MNAHTAGSVTVVKYCVFFSTMQVIIRSSNFGTRETNTYQKHSCISRANLFRMNEFIPKISFKNACFFRKDIHSTMTRKYTSKLQIF